jgi:hypothetical protein
MKTRIGPQIIFGRVAAMGLMLGGLLLGHPGTASAADCGGPLSSSTGNIVGSALGAVGGGLLGSQFGGGAGKGVITGLGVVGGALAGGYAGRSVEGCPTHRRAASAGAGGRTCRFVSSPATDGQAPPAEGVACLEQDGSWQAETGPAAEQAASADLVLRAQQRLHDQGFYVRNNIDGRWGPGTSTAVGNFQRANGMTATGQLDLTTQTALGLAPVSLADLAQSQPAQAQPAQGAPPAATAAPATTTPVATTPASGEPGSFYK